MKKIITLLLVVITVTTSGYAQIGHVNKVTTDSYKKIEYQEPEAPKDHNFLVKGGIGFVYSTDYNDNGTDFKYNLALGYQHQITKGGLYLGALAGITDFGHVSEHNSDHDTCIGIYIAPLFGAKRDMGNNRTLDLHIALGYGYDFIENFDDKSHFMYEVGAGVWFNKVYFGLGYQGALSDYTDNYGLLFEIGFRF